MIRDLSDSSQRALLSLYAKETGHQWSQPSVICDMDGVLVDFVTGFEQFHELPRLKWEPGEYSIAEKTGISLDTLSTGFWADLPAHELAPTFRDIINGNPFAIVASRCHPDLEGARAIWLYTHGIKRMPYLTQRLKADLFDLNTSAVLIDDNDAEIDAWPGPKILVPRPWNSNRGKKSYEYTVARAMALGLLGPLYTYGSPTWDLCADACLKYDGIPETIADLRRRREEYEAAREDDDNDNANDNANDAANGIIEPERTDP
jgi:hypothetical protein